MKLKLIVFFHELLVQNSKMEMTIEQLFNDIRVTSTRVFGTTFDILYKMYLDDKRTGRKDSFSIDTWFKITNITKCKKIYNKTLLMCLMFGLALYDNDYHMNEPVLAKVLLAEANKFDKDDPHIYVHTRTILEKYIEKFGK